VRLIEEPKPLLKHIQHVLLREILDRIPLHRDAHGFRRHRSALTYAHGHLGQRVVVHLDIEDFFASIAAGRIYGIFRRCGYPEPVAHLLTGLVTNTVPHRVWAEAHHPPNLANPARLAAHRRLGNHLSHAHLPQGAPSSPSLANLAAFSLDRRIAALANSMGMTYSRYADDLALSSARHRSNVELATTVELITRIAAHEGFRINPHKTSVRRASQRQVLAGIVVNERPNIDRREYDRLKATINNIARYGPASQNRTSHPHFRDQLLGRIAWVSQLNPARGERLAAAFATIDWPQSLPETPTLAPLG
jgi:hypothetical protein